MARDDVYGTGENSKAKTNWGGVAGGILGMAAPLLGRVFADSDDRRQLKQQKALNAQQVESQKEMAQYNHGMQLDMWEKTGYGAQKKQMEDAGLNSALLYGGGGGGGQTVGGMGGSGASGGSAADAAATQNAGTQSGMAMMQGAMMKAQIENINANTAKTKVDAAKTAGVDTENVAAATGLLNTSNKLKTIEANVAEATYQETIERVMAESTKAMNDAAIGTVDASVARLTKDERIEQIKQSLKQTVETVRNAKKAGNLMEAETVIKQFEAELTKQGIAPGSPWFVKILSNLLDGVGLGLQKGVDSVKTVIK